MVLTKGKRIILRKFREADAEEYLKATNDFSIQRYVPFACPDNLDESVELLENYSEADCLSDFFLVIEEIKSGKIIGSIQSFRTTTNSLDTSYFIFSDFRGKGFCLEALRTFITYISKNTDYNLLEFSVRNKNKASQKIMEKLSAKKVGQKKSLNYYQYQIKSAK